MTRLFNACSKLACSKLACSKLARTRLASMRPALALLCLLALAACATMANQRTKYDQAVYAWSGFIRWGDFEGAMNLIDPEVRKGIELTPLQLERYRQVQISTYRDVGATVDMDSGKSVRDIEIGVINRHTMAERTVRYREVWRWDPVAKAWWITTPLPDLWEGQ